MLFTVKMEMCSFHMKNRCQRGSKCRYAHSKEEVGGKVVDWKRMGCKVTMCKYWEQGRCWNTADNCEYAHGAAQQSDPAKYEKQKGKTKWGNTWWRTTGNEYQEQVPPPPPAKYPAELVNMECKVIKIGIVYVCLQCYF